MRGRPIRSGGNRDKDDVHAPPVALLMRATWGPSRTFCPLDQGTPVLRLPREISALVEEEMPDSSYPREMSRPVERAFGDGRLEPCEALE